MRRPPKYNRIVVPSGRRIAAPTEGVRGSRYQLLTPHRPDGGGRGSTSSAPTGHLTLTLGLRPPKGKAFRCAAFYFTIFTNPLMVMSP